MLRLPQAGHWRDDAVAAPPRVHPPAVAAIQGRVVAILVSPTVAGKAARHRACAA